LIDRVLQLTGLRGASDSVIQKLHSSQNAAARLIGLSVITSRMCCASCIGLLSGDEWTTKLPA